MIRCSNCGHLREYHEHWRVGTDCSEWHLPDDGDDRRSPIRCSCTRFIPPAVGAWRQLVDWVQERFRARR